MKRNRILISSGVAHRVLAGGAAAFVLLCHATLGQTIPNPSFETDTFTVSPGYISGNTAITGWTGTPADRVGSIQPVAARLPTTGRFRPATTSLLSNPTLLTRARPRRLAPPSAVSGGNDLQSHVSRKREVGQHAERESVH